MYHSSNYRSEYVHIQAYVQDANYRNLGDIQLSYGSGQYIWLTIQEAYDVLNAIEGAIQEFHAKNEMPQLTKED